MKTELYDLYQATEDLFNYLNGLEAMEVDRDILMALTHSINEAYVEVASILDKAELGVVS